MSIRSFEPVEVVCSNQAWIHHTISMHLSKCDKDRLEMHSKPCLLMTVSSKLAQPVYQTALQAGNIHPNDQLSMLQKTLDVLPTTRTRLPEDTAVVCDETTSRALKMLRLQML